MGPEELDTSQRAYGPRIRNHCLAEIEGENVEEQGEFVRPVRLVRVVPPTENSWNCSDYACLHSATVNRLLLPTRRHHRRYPPRTVPLPSLMYADRPHCGSEDGDTICLTEQVSLQTRYA